MDSYGNQRPSSAPLPGDPVSVIDLGYLLETLIVNRWIIIGWTVSAAALAVIFALLLDNEYTADARVLIDPQQSQVVDFRRSEARAQMNESVIESKSYVLRSNRVLERVVEELELYKDPNFVIFEDTDPQMSRRLAMKTLNESLTIRQAGISFVLNVEATTYDPLLAANIANTVANTFVAVESEGRLETAKQANAWLLERLSALQERVSISSAKLENFRAVSGVAVERRISDLSQYLERLRMSLSEVSRVNGDVNAVEDTRGSTLKERIAETEAQLRELTDKTVELRELERQSDADRELYERFLERAKELDELQNFQVADARVISDALQPLLPSGPRRKLIVILGAIFGLAIGTGIVAIREIFSSMSNPRSSSGSPKPSGGPHNSDNTTLRLTEEYADFR